MQEPQNLRDRVIGALLVVLAMALVIGGVAGAVAYGAVRATGIGEDTAAAASPSSSAPAPSGQTQSPSPSASPTPVQQATPTHHATPKPKKRKPKPRRHRHHRARPRGRLTLAASRHRVSPMGRIVLHGRYPGHGGTRLVVQRMRGGRWTRFPVSVTVRGGSFRTWVASGHRGPNHFRVLDPRSGRASAPVTVRVG